MRYYEKRRNYTGFLFLLKLAVKYFQMLFN